MSNWAFVGLAFGLSWVVLIGYTVTLFRRAGAARRALEMAIQAEIELARTEESLSVLTPAEVA